jgi:ABC-2 type transport system ATP-binding protein
METIRCQGLTKRYGNITALDNLNLEIEEKSVFGFLGPNGAGKTTTIRLLTGLSLPSAGIAWVADEDVTSNPLTLRRKVGYLPDVPAFYEWMSGREFLHFIGELHSLSVPERNKRTEEILELVDLREAAGRRIGGYSRGMKQRLGIAQALMNRPEVLFMDEPTSALDPIGRRDVLLLIERLSRETTIFMSTHILSDVERVCDTVGIIDRGRLVIESTVEELRQRYARSAFELEFEEDAAPLLAKLDSIPWLEKWEMVTVNETPILRIQARDVDRAKQELLQMVATSGLTLLRYELTLPSLEDIFVELMAGGGKE